MNTLVQPSSSPVPKFSPVRATVRDFPELASLGDRPLSDLPEPHRSVWAKRSKAFAQGEIDSIRRGRRMTKQLRTMGAGDVLIEDLCPVTALTPAEQMSVIEVIRSAMSSPVKC